MENKMKGHNYGLCKKCKKRHNHPRGSLDNHSGWSKYNWKGGERNDPYPRLFYSMRSIVLERDNYTCQDCGNKGNAIHHKDENKNNNSIDNLVTLCVSCHTICHWKNHKNKSERRELCVS